MRGAPARPACRGGGAGPGSAPAIQGEGSPAAHTAHGFRHIYLRKDLAPRGMMRWYGDVWHGKKKLTTNLHSTAEEAARAVDRCGLTRALTPGPPSSRRRPTERPRIGARVARRYLYKLRGPEACNFPVTPELAAELDALTVEQIREQFRQRCAREGARRTGGVVCLRCGSAPARLIVTRHARAALLQAETGALQQVHGRVLQQVPGQVGG